MTNSDFKDLLAALSAHDVRFLVVGGYAVTFHARPRFTQDLDIWVEPTEANAGSHGPDPWIQEGMALVSSRAVGWSRDFEVVERSSDLPLRPDVRRPTAGHGGAIRSSTATCAPR